MNESVQHLVLEINSEYANILWPNTLFNVICLVIGILGNGYVLYINKFKLDDKTGSRYFIPYLAIDDALASLITGFGFTYRNFQLFFPRNGLCKGLLFGAGVTGFMSAFLLLAIAVQRYRMIIKPHGKQFTLFLRKIALLIIFITSVCFSVPITFIADVQEINGTYKGFNLTGSICWMRDDEYASLQNAYFGFSATVFVVNIVVTLILYIPIAIDIYRRHRKTKTPSMNIQARGSSLNRTASLDIDHTLFEQASMGSSSNVLISVSPKTRSLKTASTNFNGMFVAIVVAYVVSYIPTCVMATFFTDPNPLTWRDLPTRQLRVYSILAQTYVINNAINPFIYGFFDMQFRKQIVRHIRCGKL